MVKNYFIHSILSFPPRNMVRDKLRRESRFHSVLDCRVKPDNDKTWGKHRLLIILICVVFINKLLHPHQSFAQELSLSVSPPLTEMIIQPDKSVIKRFKVSNKGDAIIVTVQLLPYAEEGINLLTPPGEDAWIELANSDIQWGKPFLLEHSEEKDIVLQFQPGKETRQQDYYRVLAFSSQPAIPSESSQSSVQEIIGSIILINVSSNGLTARGIQIARFSMPYIIDSFEPAVIDIDVKNTGNTYVRLFGAVSLSGPIGRAQYRITPQILLPHQNRHVRTNTTTSKQSSSLSAPGFYIGKYEVNASLSLNKGNIKAGQTMYFYAFPWKAGLFLISVYGIVRIVRRRSKKSQKLA